MVNYDKVIDAVYPLLGPYDIGDPIDFKLDLQGWLDIPELLDNIIESINPSIIIEVGSWKGSSAVRMAQKIRKDNRDCAVVAIDTWLGGIEHFMYPENSFVMLWTQGYPGGLYEQFMYNVQTLGLQDIIVPFRQTSNIAYKILKIKEIQSEFIFIDGSHEYQDVYQDVTNYFELLTVGGIMLCDDYGNWPEVKKAIDLFIQEHEGQLTHQTLHDYIIIKKEK